MITLTASAAYGFGGKQFVARITGRHEKFTFAYEFLGRKEGKRGESTSADVDTPGLYITRNWGRKNNAEDSYVLIIEKDGELEECSADKADAMKIAKALDAGRRFDEIVEVDANGWRMLTPKAAEMAAVAQTIDTAAEACWKVLMSLPEKEAKKVLAILKTRVSPPKPAAALQPTSDTPAQELVLDTTPVELVAE
jgi:hypothetical protein